MPAMSDITVDPYHENDPDLSLEAPKLDSTTAWTWPSGSNTHDGQMELPSSTEIVPSSSSSHHSDGEVTIKDGPIYVGPVMGMLPEASCQPEYTRQGDIRDSSAEPGMSGLCNLGNTCFMNSGIQCLVSNPRLNKFLLEEFEPEDEEVMCNSITGQFALLQQKIWSGRYSIIRPSSLKEMLGVYHPQFKDYRQHDCQEFLALLLDSLHEQLNLGSSMAKIYTSSEDIDQLDLPALSPDQQIDGSRSPGNNTQVKPKVCAVQHLLSGTKTAASKDVRPLLDQSSLASSSLGSEDSCQSESSVNCSSTSQLRCESVPEEVTPFVIPSAVEQGQIRQVIPCKDWNNQPNNLSREHCSSSERSKTHISLAIIENKQTSPSPPTNIVITAVPVEVDSSEVKASVSSSRTANHLKLERLSEDGRKLPSLEDLYMKDTKTLNTNVLVSDLAEEEDMAVDSEKFHKQENTSPIEVNTGQVQFDFEHLNDLLTLDTAKGDSVKPFKETNLLANVKEKFPEDSCSKKFLFSEIAEDEHYSINNIKRIKIDEEEKNSRMQAKLKVNMDKNVAKPTNIGANAHMIHSLACTVPNNVDALTQDPPMCSSGISVSEGDHSFLRQGVHNRVGNQVWRPPSVQHVHMAEKAWRKHLSRHHSVIVDTFQGQFKSTVVCSECHHVSVTFEPFMYLSVPLPHAMDRQISVIFVPCDNKQPVRYLLTLHKQDVVRRLKLELLRLVGEEACEIIIAEVLDNHIARILEDNTMLRFLNDSNRTMYAFEMLPAPQIEDITDNPDMLSGDHDNSGVISSSAAADNSLSVAPNNIVSSSTSVSMVSSVQSTESSTSPAPAMDNTTCAVTNVAKHTEEITSSTDNVALLDEQNILNNSTDNPANQSCTSEADFKCAIDFQHNPLSVADSTTGLRTETDTANWLAENEAISSTNDAMDETLNSHGAVQSEKDIVGEREAEESGPTAADQWKTCAICLEEMIDSDLLAHGACGGTLCHTCLEMTFKHYGDAGLMCPVCSTPVDPVQDFIQLDAMADYRPKTRILSIPVVHRLEGADCSGKVTMRLFGHPNILYLPSNTDGEYLYASVDRVVLCLSSYSIVLTDGQGYRCSRCLYTQHCAGCELPREGHINLQPGDHLAIKFSGLTVEQIDTTHNFVDHQSMEGLLPKTPLTLFDCFQAFTQSELLDEHNPWFCPRCKKNQCANKTMTVWKYPETLVVYLKRFVFHELSGTKIDNKVVFPVEDLDLSSYISGPMCDTLKYDLHSCVCHFGGVNSGHYTAYAKNCFTRDWTYFNDETMTKKQPQDEDYSNAYILFYQRQGTNVSFNAPEKLSQYADISGFDLPSDGCIIPPSSPITAEFPGPCGLALPDSGFPFPESSQGFDMIGCHGRRSSDAGSMTTEADSSTVCESFDYYS